MVMTRGRLMRTDVLFVFDRQHRDTITYIPLALYQLAKGIFFQ